MANEKLNPLRGGVAEQALDANLLGGHPATYFATQTALAQVTSRIYPIFLNLGNVGLDHMNYIKEHWGEIPQTHVFAGILRDNNLCGIIGYKTNNEIYGGVLCMVYRHLYYYSLANGTWTATTLV